MSIVVIVLHDPLSPAAPMAVRVFLVCRTSRVMIIKVRMTSKETETERCGRMTTTIADPELQSHPMAWRVSIMIPVAILMPLALSVTADSWRT